MTSHTQVMSAVFCCGVTAPPAHSQAIVPCTHVATTAPVDAANVAVGATNPRDTAQGGNEHLWLT